MPVLFLLLRYSYSVGVGRKECHPNVLVLGASCNHCCERVGVCSARSRGPFLSQCKRKATAGLAGKLVGGKSTPCCCAGLPFCLISVRKICSEQPKRFILFIYLFYFLFLFLWLGFTIQLNQEN